MSSQTYVLEVGEKDEERLDLVDEVHGAETRKFLAKFLKPWMQVLEVGCGTGNVSRWIADQLTDKGMIVATDISSEQIAIASSRPTPAKLAYEAADVYHLEKFHGKFDLVFTRYVLHHVNKPETALKSMLSCLKPNGLIIVEEPNHLDWFCSLNPDAVSRFKNTFIKVGKLRNVDYTIGNRVHQLLSNINVEILDQTTAQATESSITNKMMPLYILRKIKNDVLQNNILSEPNFIALFEEIKAITLNDSDLLYPKMVLVSGKR